MLTHHELGSDRQTTDYSILKEQATILEKAGSINTDTDGLEIMIGDARILRVTRLKDIILAQLDQTG